MSNTIANPKDTPFQLMMDQDMHTLVQKLAANGNMSMASFVRAAIQNGINYGVSPIKVNQIAGG